MYCYTNAHSLFLINTHLILKLCQYIQYNGIINENEEARYSISAS